MAKTLYFFPNGIANADKKLIEEFFEPNKMQRITCDNGYVNTIRELKKSDKRIFYTDIPTFLREHDLWFDTKLKSWQIFFHCQNMEFKSIYELTNKEIREAHHLENIFLNGGFKEK